MKKVYLVMHQQKSNTASIISQVVCALERVGIKAVGEPWLAETMGEEVTNLTYHQSVVGCDAILSIGGDGTFLRANAMAMERGLPLLGINLGTVGFLSEIEWDQLSAACDCLAKEQYTIESRMMLQVQMGNACFYALNDVVLNRGGYARLIGLNVGLEGERVGPYIGDGLVISTPTGSTGYSLSAGGPIVHPKVECIILTPICAHSLQHRPVVTAATQQITISLDATYNHSAQVDVDGQQALFLSEGQELTITRSPQSARLIHLKPPEFFSTIRIKLAEWSR